MSQSYHDTITNMKSQQKKIIVGTDNAVQKHAFEYCQVFFYIDRS